MSYETLKADLAHVSVMVPTLFTGDATEINETALRAHTNSMVDAGAKSFIPCGGTGEIASLTQAERRSVAEVVTDAVGDQGRVIAGVEGGIKDARSLIQEYEDVGVDGIMLRPGKHPARGPHQQALLEYYHTLITSTDLGVMIYKEDPYVTDGMIQELGLLENVIAVKYIDDPDSFATTRERLSGKVLTDLTWINGNAESRATEFGLEGVVPFTSSISNFVPETSFALFEALSDEAWGAAKRIQNRLRPILDVYWAAGEESTIRGGQRRATVKYGIELAGGVGGPARVPVLPALQQTEKERLRSAYQRLESSDEGVDRAEF